MDSVQITLRRDVYARLQRMAEPLIDDANSVLERLLKHWEDDHPAPRLRRASAQDQPAFWRSARGEKLPIGTKLRAVYLKKLFEAEVTADGIFFNGKTYDNPSSAGMAAKIAVGTTGKAASTNGWEFWEALDPRTRKWGPIDRFRASDAA